jgi:hypothetical protein
MLRSAKYEILKELIEFDDWDDSAQAQRINFFGRLALWLQGDVSSQRSGVWQRRAMNGRKL